MRRLLNLTRDSRLALLGTILFGFLTGLLIIAQASALSRIVNGVFLLGWGLAEAAALVRWILGIVFLRALLAWGSEVSATGVAVRVKGDLRRRLFGKILELGPAYTRGERTGELVNAAVEGVEALDAYYSQYLPQLVLAALVPLSILVAVFPHDPLSGLVLLLTAPLIPVFMYLIGKTAETLTKRQWETLNRLSAHFFDSLQGLTTLKEFGRSQDHARSIDEASQRFRDVTLNVLRVTFLSALVLELVATISTAIVAVEVGLRLLYGHMQFQEALFLLVLAPEFYVPLRMLGLRFHAGMAGTAAAKRIFEILDLPGSPEPPAPAGSASLGTFQTLDLSDISYTYPGESQPALQNIRLEIRAGERVALVGRSGAGKSTLAALLLRFTEPGRGSVRVNGTSLAEIPAAAWRELVTWVPQSPYLFHDTLAANLRLADPQASDAQLEAAARAAHLDGFVRSLPAGWQTVIGEQGARLSAGQAQRLALARAFLKQAPILLLDEPSSNLDPQNEAWLEEALRTLQENGWTRAIVTIAHRLNTVMQADRIFVLENGRLVETGRHTELLAAGGAYARLVGPARKLPAGPAVGRPAERLETAERGEVGPVEQPQTATSRPVYRRLLGFLEGAWGWVALSVLLGLLTIGSSVGLMGTSAFLIAAAALHPELGTLQVAIVGVRFFGIARGVFRYAERLSSHNVTFRLLARLRSWFYRALEPLAPAQLMQYRSGDLLARIVADVDTLENFYVRAVAPPLVAMLVAAGMAVFYAGYSAGLAWIYLAFTLLLGLCVPLLAWVMGRSIGAELVRRRAGLQARLVDGIQGLADLLAFGQECAFADDLAAREAALGKTQRRSAVLSGVSVGLTTLLVNLGMLAVLVRSIILVGQGRLPGVLLAALTLAGLAGFEAVMPLPQAAQSLAACREAARRLFEVVDARPEVVDPAAPRPVPAAAPGVQFSRVSFCYPGNAWLALEAVDLSLAPGQRLAVVGPSGAGKTSLANLLLRFWTPTQGCLLLNSQDLAGYAQEDVRRLVSCVSQRTFFFNDTIRNNLLLARPVASQDDLWEVLRKAQIDEFVRQLPKGLETVIGERGFRLSGGERQRLAIARALLKDAPILLLDEPTANLDALTERLILEQVLAARGGRSLLLITHRLVGLEQMDEIVVLENGRIVERGSQAGLLSAGGLYFRLWSLQNRLLEDGAAR